MIEVQVVVEVMREKILSRQSEFCGGANHSAEKCFKRIRKDGGKSRAAGDSEKQHTESNPHKCFRCGSEDPLIAKLRKPPKEN